MADPQKAATPETVDVYGTDGQVHSVPHSDLALALRNGGELTVDVTAPDGSVRPVPMSQVRNAQQAGGLLKGSAPAMPNIQPKFTDKQAEGEMTGQTTNDVGAPVIVPKEGESFADTMKRGAAQGKAHPWNSNPNAPPAYKSMPWLGPATDNPDIKKEEKTMPAKTLQVLASTPVIAALGTAPALLGPAAPVAIDAGGTAIAPTAWELAKDAAVEGGKWAAKKILPWAAGGAGAAIAKKYL